MLRILYVHGFGSRVDPESEKYKSLSALGEVVPVAPDYSKPYSTIMQSLVEVACNTDLMVGTSMGGFSVSRLSQMTGIPFVAINPVLFPQRTLRKYLGTRTDYYGVTFTLTDQTVATYPVFSVSRKGMVLLDLGDELIDARETLTCLNNAMRLHAFEGGTHRFSHMHESVPLIGEFLEAVARNGVAEPKDSGAGYGRYAKRPLILDASTADADLCCPVCSRVLLREAPPDEVPDPCRHVRFIFLDSGGNPFSLDDYELLESEVHEWLAFLQTMPEAQEDDRDARDADLLLACPLVDCVLVHRPVGYSPFYRVLWGISGANIEQKDSVEQFPSTWSRQ